MTRMAQGLPTVAGILLIAACGGKPPAPVADAAPPTMPADHPPIGAAAPVAGPRLPPATVMARYGDAVITAGDLDEAMAAMPAADRLEYNSAETVRDLVESLVDRRLMAAQARKAGFADPAAGDTDEVLAARWLERELAKLPPPGEAEIERYYREHAAEFTEPRRVRVTRLITQRREAAERVRGDLGRGASLDAIRNTASGDLVGADEIWLQDVAQPPDMTTVALGLRPGEVSPVLAADRGFMVMRAEQIVSARLRPLAESKSGIAASLEETARTAAMQSMHDRLRKGVQVTIVEDAISSYASASTALPAASAAGQ